MAGLTGNRLKRVRKNAKKAKSCGCRRTITQQGSQEWFFFFAGSGIGRHLQKSHQYYILLIEMDLG